MKKFVSIFIILAVAVSLFLVTVSADTVEDFKLSLSYNIMQMPEQYVSIGVSTDIDNKDSYLVSHEEFDDITMDYLTLLRFSADIVNSTSSVIIKAGETFDISLSGIHLGLGVNGSAFVWKQTPSLMYFQVYYNDGTFTRLNELSFTYSSFTDTQAISCHSVAQKDIYRIVFYEEIPQYSVTSMHGLFPVDIWMGDTVTPTYMQVDIQSKESGMLGDINNELDNIANGTVEPDKSPADDKVNDVGQHEDQLLQDTAQGRENIVQYITQAIAELSAYATAFVALNAIVDGFFYLPIIGPLIIISLSLGIFALIVNLAQTATRSDIASKPKGKGSNL